MVNEQGNIERRHFLIKSAYFFTCSLLGLGGLKKAFAHEGKKARKTGKPQIALIIDDIGYNKDTLRQFLRLEIPLTFAVLPRLRNTKNFAEEIHSNNHEIILHQPMEPYNSSLDPGPGALFVKDKSTKIIKVLEENICNTPHIKGLNNHMGSRFTSSRDKMNEALHVIKDYKLFFIDSLTTSQSTAYESAKKLDIAAGFRNIFLDNKPDEERIKCQLRRLLSHAERFGHGIGIGHPYVATARAIEHFIGNINRNDISLVNASTLIPL
ncbi:MAG: divergent polysaccharide deacetylase family protein [Deltaproteobacteria bacterium]|nr:divergent polysaccharide deacetylase family protein [Deltaproteobacteria bacterium]